MEGGEDGRTLRSGQGGDKSRGVEERPAQCTIERHLFLAIRRPQGDESLASQRQGSHIPFCTGGEELWGEEEVIQEATVGEDLGEERGGGREQQQQRLKDFRLGRWGWIRDELLDQASCLEIISPPVRASRLLAFLLALVVALHCLVFLLQSPHQQEACFVMHCIIVGIVVVVAESITLVVARLRLLLPVHRQRLLDHVFLEEGLKGSAALLLQRLHFSHLGAGLAFPRHGSGGCCDGKKEEREERVRVGVAGRRSVA